MTLSVPFPHFVNQLAWWHNSCYKSQESCLTRTFPRKVHAEETTRFAIIALVLWAIVLLELQLGEKNILEILQLMHERTCFEKQAWCDLMHLHLGVSWLSWWSDMKPREVSTTQIQRHWGATDNAVLALSCPCPPTWYSQYSKIELSSLCPFFEGDLSSGNH